ncbi:MAG: MBL fold metallo-hydrolase [Clostridia bacterium]|nr:MBL fold metallo-hydrolase [Clostridia bacterium]
MAKFVTLFSSSSGNSYYIGSSGQGVLIDAGRSCKQIEMAMQSNNLDLRNVRAVFITHEHSDHCQGLKVLASRYGFTVYGSEGTLNALERSDKLSSRFTADVIETKVSIGDMLIERHNTPHDSAESCAYSVTTPDGRRATIATDMGIMLPDVREAIKKSSLAVIESNHDIDMLRCGPYPYVLKKRILSDKGHLSNKACAEELPELVKSGVNRIILGHLSKENNTPLLAYNTSLESLTKEGLALGLDFTLEVAPVETNGKSIIF